MLPGHRPHLHLCGRDRPHPPLQALPVRPGPAPHEECGPRAPHVGRGRRGLQRGPRHVCVRAPRRPKPARDVPRPHGKDGRLQRQSPAVGRARWRGLRHKRRRGPDRHPAARWRRVGGPRGSRWGWGGQRIQWGQRRMHDGIPGRLVEGHGGVPGRKGARERDVRRRLARRGHLLLQLHPVRMRWRGRGLLRRRRERRRQL
jgi:hypothetical protein